MYFNSFCFSHLQLYLYSNNNQLYFVGFDLKLKHIVYFKFISSKIQNEPDLFFVLDNLIVFFSRSNLKLKKHKKLNMSSLNMPPELEQEITIMKAQQELFEKVKLEQ